MLSTGTTAVPFSSNGNVFSVPSTTTITSPLHLGIETVIFVFSPALASFGVSIIISWPLTVTFNGLN